MNYFREIIFPPVIKPNSIDGEEDGIINFDSIFGLKYWFEYIEGYTKLMVRCPVCSRVYCYSRVGQSSRASEIALAVKENPKYFESEWIGSCPHVSSHEHIMNAIGGYV